MLDNYPENDATYNKLLIGNTFVDFLIFAKSHKFPCIKVSK